MSSNLAVTTVASELNFLLLCYCQHASCLPHLRFRRDVLEGTLEEMMEEEEEEDRYSF